MTELCSFEQLIEDAADFLSIERRSLLIEELLHVLVKVFEHQEKFVFLQSMDDVFQVDYVLIVA